MTTGPNPGDSADTSHEGPGIHPIRDQQRDAAIVFIHGFGTNSERTWGSFLAIVSDEPTLAEWDIYSVGYSTGLLMDIAGLWKASPPIGRLSEYLNTAILNQPLDRYESLAIVAHSMGGLVTQRALVDSAEARRSVGHLICFGSPSGGLRKTSLFTLWKRQIRDMDSESKFINDLRTRWQEQFGDNPPFSFKVVAGDQDEFVPAWSTLEPFADKFRCVVPGNHMTIVTPSTSADLSVRVLVKHLTGDAAEAGPWNSARVAVERREFQQAIDQLWPHRTELDDATMVTLSLALDSVGRREDAIEVLRDSGRESTSDQMGTLAGRLKRRWLVERRREDAEGARALYADALAAAQAVDRPEQVFYHAINLAFMTLAVDGDPNGAKEWARTAMENAAKADENTWSLATIGEANLYLGDPDAALTAYREVLKKNPRPWQISSMFQQAALVAELRDDEDTAERIRSLFRERQA